MSMSCSLLCHAVVNGRVLFQIAVFRCRSGSMTFSCKACAFHGLRAFTSISCKSFFKSRLPSCFAGKERGAGGAAMGASSFDQSSCEFLCRHGGDFWAESVKLCNRLLCVAFTVVEARPLQQRDVSSQCCCSIASHCHFQTSEQDVLPIIPSCLFGCRMPPPVFVQTLSYYLTASNTYFTCRVC